MGFYTIPSEEELERCFNKIPDYMEPNKQPLAVVYPSFLSAQQCDDIIFVMEKLEPYQFGSCGAATRESGPPMDSVLAPVAACGSVANDLYFNFDITNERAAWFQTYFSGGDYHLHTDWSPGQGRKLTAVALLSDPSEYEGGQLILSSPPDTYIIPNARGTIAIFPGWLSHEVTEITWGKRKTINLGFWGPPFR